MEPHGVFFFLFVLTVLATVDGSKTPLDDTTNASYRGRKRSVVPNVVTVSLDSSDVFKEHHEVVKSDAVG
jgi:hypothetical protein